MIVIMIVYDVISVVLCVVVCVLLYDLLYCFRAIVLRCVNGCMVFLMILYDVCDFV